MMTDLKTNASLLWCWAASADALYTPDSEGVQAILRPLFETSWLIDDFLSDNCFFDATRVLLSSASSKTAYGTAFQVHQRDDIEVIGLTSAAHKTFRESLGCYHHVLASEELDQLQAKVPCVYVDFAGNANLRRGIQGRLSHLKHSCSVDGTRVEQLGGARDLPGRRLAEGWHAFRHRPGNPSAPWLRVRRHDGAAKAQAASTAMLASHVELADGHVLSPQP